MRLFVGARCGGDEYALAHPRLEFLELKRPIIHRRRQPETVGHQRFLARAVSPVHAAQLPNGDVALVDEHERIARQIVDQRGRRVARGRAGKMAGIVFDPLAEPEFGQHFKVKPGALLQSLRLNQLAAIDEKLDAIAQLLLDGHDRAQHRIARRDVMRTRVDGEPGYLLPHTAGQRIKQLEALDLVVEQ